MMTEAPEVSEDFVEKFHEAMASAAGTNASYQGDQVDLMKMSAHTCLMEIPGDQVQITLARMMAIMASLKGRTIKDVQYTSQVNGTDNVNGLVGTFTLVMEPEAAVLSA